jgi:hypothetical protein
MDYFWTHEKIARGMKAIRHTQGHFEDDEMGYRCSMHEENKKYKNYASKMSSQSERNRGRCE